MVFSPDRYEGPLSTHPPAREATLPYNSMPYTTELMTQPLTVVRNGKGETVPYCAKQRDVLSFDLEASDDNQSLFLINKIITETLKLRAKFLLHIAVVYNKYENHKSEQKLVSVEVKKIITSKKRKRYHHM